MRSALLLLAPTHDPGTYPNPHKFDIERHDTHHHSFGGGIHHCIGAPLARAEAQIAINALLARYPNIELARPVNRRNVPIMQGCEALWVKLGLVGRWRSLARRSTRFMLEPYGSRRAPCPICR